jgi:hypothetical protein
LSQDASLASVVRNELEKARQREQHLELVEPPADADLAAWHHFGRLTRDEITSLRARAFSDVVEPCVLALLSEPTSEPMTTEFTAALA